MDVGIPIFGGAIVVGGAAATYGGFQLAAAHRHATSSTQQVLALTAEALTTADATLVDSMDAIDNLVLEGRLPVTQVVHHLTEAELGPMKVVPFIREARQLGSEAMGVVNEKLDDGRQVVRTAVNDTRALTATTLLQGQDIAHTGVAKASAAALRGGIGVGVGGVMVSAGLAGVLTMTRDALND